MLKRLVALCQQAHEGALRVAKGQFDGTPDGCRAVDDDLEVLSCGRCCGQLGANLLHGVARGVLLGVDEVVGPLGRLLWQLPAAFVGLSAGGA